MTPKFQAAIAAFAAIGFLSTLVLLSFGLGHLLRWIFGG